MNKFDQVFFKKYVPEWNEIIEIAHKHIFLILNQIIINYFFWVILPTFIYYNSLAVQSIIPFFVLEIFIILIFFKNIYDIFNWYNDVWIITKDGVIELDWALFSSNSTSVKYSSIEWLELIQTGFIDTILGKWDVLIHKIWWENNFLLKDASRAFSVLEKVDQIQKALKQQKKDDKKDSPEQNFETILKALSGVVEEYLWKNWYKEEDSEERKQLIEKVKKINGTIDLNSKKE